MKRGGCLLAFVTAGALVRIVLLRAPEVWYDEATTGLMGLAVLRGDFPLYFFGQPFMGALDACLAAPLYLTLGVSVRVLKLLPLVLVLVWMALTMRLAWEGFGRGAATFTAALLALPPDFLLSWSVEARPHYQMSVRAQIEAIALMETQGPARLYSNGPGCSSSRSFPASASSFPTLMRSAILPMPGSSTGRRQWAGGSVGEPPVSARA